MSQKSSRTHIWTFQYTRLLFGISSAPGILIESILQGIDGVVVYLDDILITGVSKEAHLKTLDEVLSRLDRAGLQIIPDGCLSLRTFWSPPPKGPFAKPDSGSNWKKMLTFAQPRKKVFGIWYLSKTGFTVTLKSPQIRTEFLPRFRTATIGAAHSANSTGFMVPSSWRRCSSCSFSLKA